MSVIIFSTPVAIVYLKDLFYENFILKSPKACNYKLLNENLRICSSQLSELWCKECKWSRKESYLKKNIDHFKMRDFKCCITSIIIILHSLQYTLTQFGLCLEGISLS